MSKNLIIQEANFLIPMKAINFFIFLVICFASCNNATQEKHSLDKADTAIKAELIVPSSITKKHDLKGIIYNVKKNHEVPLDTVDVSCDIIRVQDYNFSDMATIRIYFIKKSEHFFEIYEKKTVSGRIEKHDSTLISDRKKIAIMNEKWNDIIKKIEENNVFSLPTFRYSSPKQWRFGAIIIEMMNHGKYSELYWNFNPKDKNKDIVWDIFKDIKNTVLLGLKKH